MKPFIENKYFEIGHDESQWVLLPTIIYNPVPYRYPVTRPVYIMFLNFYILIGKPWEDTKAYKKKWGKGWGDD